MTTKTKQRGQISADEASAAYIAAIQQHQEAEQLATRVALASEVPGPSDEKRRAEAKRTDAMQTMIKARAALEATAGETAVQLAEARVGALAIAREVADTRFSRRTPAYSENLAVRERAAQLEVERLTARFDEEQARAEEYERREADNGPLLADLDAELGAARAQLARTAQAAQAALAAVHAAAEHYGSVAADARRRLAAAGFGGDRRPDGQPFPTAAGPELRVQGNAWPVPHAQQSLAWTVRRTMIALGMGGSPIDYALRRLVSVEQHTLDMLLAEQANGSVVWGGE